MRLPNGYGSVAKLSGKRRKPYIVRKTTGFDERGYPIYSIIGYAETREDGLLLLAKYNNDPWDIKGAKVTLNALYEQWLKERAVKLSESNYKALKGAYRHCAHLEDLPYKSIRASQMQSAIDNCGKSYSQQSHIKNLWRHLDRYAFELDIINKCYSELLTSDSIPETGKIPFTAEEINRVWDNQDKPYVDTILIFLYSGWRLNELFNIKVSDVDLDAGIMTGGLKSRAGKGRIVPIHSKIFEIVKRRAAEGNEYLLSRNGKKYYAQMYHKIWRNMMKEMSMAHTPHECRHTFRTWLDTAGANTRCMDLLMGHTSKSIGDRVYNHKTIKDLKNAIELVTY